MPHQVEERLYSPGDWVCVSKYYWMDYGDMPLRPSEEMFKLIQGYVDGENEKGLDEGLQCSNR